MKIVVVVLVLEETAKDDDQNEESLTLPWSRMRKLSARSSEIRQNLPAFSYFIFLAW